jgi:endoglucanase
MRLTFALCAAVGVSLLACGGRSIRHEVGDEETGGSTGGRSGRGGSGATETGGISTGGISTGGIPAGGVSNGGVPAGGGPTTGGVSTGGVSTGGVSTGGEAGEGGVGGGPNPNLRRGINLGNRLDAPYEGAWGPVLHESDFPQIASRGFDHIRLPVKFSGHAATSPPYTLDEMFMQRVDWAIDQALANKLAIIVDFHHYEEIHTDPENHLNRFLQIWDQLSSRYQHRPPEVVFELLNEPNGALNPYWNVLLVRAIDVIRFRNPTRLVIVDAEEWAGPTAVGRLALPADPNVVASIHAYDPALFTLQGGDFAGPAFSTTGILYPGPPMIPLVPNPDALAEGWPADWFNRYNTLLGDQNPSSLGQVQREFATSTAYTRANGHAVYNGEWGCTQKADFASRVRWTRDVRRESERLGIGWAIWDDGGDISIYNADTQTWNEELLKALFD